MSPQSDQSSSSAWANVSCCPSLLLQVSIETSVQRSDCQIMDLINEFARLKECPYITVLYAVLSPDGVGFVLV